jgi:hypothetical protein
MTFVSLVINHKLRPKYRQIGTNVGKFIADAVDADNEQRLKIIRISTKAATIGLSVGCAVLTADAVGMVHAVATSAADTADAVHSAVTVHAAAATPAGHTLNAASAGHPVPSGYTGSGNTLGALRGFNQQSSIMASVGQDQANNIALSGTDGVLDQASDISAS